MKCKGSPEPSYLCSLSKTFVVDIDMSKPPEFPFLDQGQEFIIFSNGCLDLSVNILIGDMVLVLYVQ